MSALPTIGANGGYYDSGNAGDPNSASYYVYPASGGGGGGVTNYTVPWTNFSTYTNPGPPEYDFMETKQHNFYKINRYTGDCWVLHGNQWIEILHEDGE